MKILYHDSSALTVVQSTPPYEATPSTMESGLIRGVASLEGGGGY